MAEIEDLESARRSFASFLAQNALPTRIAWVFRDDTWQAGPERLIVRSPVDPGNEALAIKAYGGGRARGALELTAVGHDGSQTFATIWYPAHREEVQGWNRGLRFAIRQPCLVAQSASRLAWPFLALRPGFRRYQRECKWIGTKAWASQARG